jgi:type II secretory pathway component PulM
LNLALRSAWLRQRWNAMSRREKRLVAAAVSIVFVALLYVLVWRPLRDATERLTQDLPQLQLQAMRMRAQADALAARRSSAVPAADRAAAGDAELRALAARTQVATALTQIEPSGDARKRLRFDSVNGDALVRFLELAQRERGWRVTELQVARLSSGERVRAEIALTQ